MIHLLTYDLKQPNDTSEDYERVIAGIKADFSSWCHIELSVWLISTMMLRRFAKRSRPISIPRTFSLFRASLATGLPGISAMSATNG